MKHRVIVEYDYPVEHKTPVKADIYLHGDKVTTGNIKPLQEELEEIKEKIKKQYSHYTDYGVQLGCESSCEIIDKEIAELKGE